MSLKIPGTNIDFYVTPQYFLAEFDVYDREEDLGEELNIYNPNERDDLRKLFRKYLFSGKIVERYETEHKAEVAKSLLDMLNNADFDFDKILAEAYDSEDGFSLPSNWEIKNPRLFFLEAYRAVYEKWGEELREHGLSLIAPESFE